MRNKPKVLITAIFFISLLLVGCATMPINLGDMGRVPNENESVIVIQRANVFVGSAVNMKIYLNGQHRLTIGNGQEGHIIVPNGSYNLFAEINRHTRSENIVVNANSQRITFIASPKMGFWSNSIELSLSFETPL